MKNKSGFVILLTMFFQTFATSQYIYPNVFDHPTYLYDTSYNENNIPLYSVTSDEYKRITDSTFYNNKGAVTLKIKYDYYGNRNGEFKIFYNEIGLKIKEVNYGNTLSYAYDEKNNLVEKISFSGQDDFIDVIESYSYTPNNKVSSIVRFDFSNYHNYSMEKSTKKVLDSLDVGKFIKASGYLLEPFAIWTIERKYSSEDSLLEEKEYYTSIKDGKLKKDSLKNSIQYFYNLEKQLYKKEEKRVRQSKLITMYSYNKIGQLTELKEIEDVNNKSRIVSEAKFKNGLLYVKTEHSVSEYLGENRFSTHITQFNDKGAITSLVYIKADGVQDTTRFFYDTKGYYVGKIRFNAGQVFEEDILRYNQKGFLIYEKKDKFITSYSYDEKNRIIEKQFENKINDQRIQDFFVNEVRVKTLEEQYDEGILIRSIEKNYVEDKLNHVRIVLCKNNDETNRLDNRQQYNKEVKVTVHYDLDCK